MVNRPRHQFLAMPLSPVTSTIASDCDTCPISLNTCCIGSLLPTIPSA